MKWHGEHNDRCDNAAGIAAGHHQTCVAACTDNPPCHADNQPDYADNPPSHADCQPDHTESARGVPINHSTCRAGDFASQRTRGCVVASGVLHDPYTNTVIAFTREQNTSEAVQIDHVVALANAWQTGAQQLSLPARTNMANDPLNLLAVPGAVNEQKGDADAASWLPPNKAFRCSYVAIQVAVKIRYHL